MINKNHPSFSSLKQSRQIVALDIGKKRIGIARSSLEAKIVQPLEIINSSNESRLLEIINIYKPTVIVVGLPYNKKGELGFQAQFIKKWIIDFVAKYNLDIKIAYQDETLSSSQANLEFSSKKNISKQRLDHIAAKIILEDYLSDVKNF